MDDGEEKLTDRYDDKPFLRFVDAWVLKAIGHLDAPTENYCRTMMPQLEQSFGLKGSWTQIVEQQMKFPPDFASQVQKVWADGNDRFQAANGRPADPVQFAYHFVDRNFGSAGSAGA